MAAASGEDPAGKNGTLKVAIEESLIYVLLASVRVEGQKNTHF